MAKNNQSSIVNVLHELNSNLLTQPFPERPFTDLQLEQWKQIAQTYAKLENCISVLSDLIARKSYIYPGVIAKELGLRQHDMEIYSIWEDELLSLMHPDDLQAKYRIELQFFQFLNSVKLEERVNYEVMAKIRTRGIDGRTILLQHRLLYVNNAADDCVWLTLCIYRMVPDHPAFNFPGGMIFNKVTGAVLECSQDGFAQLLSLREKEILKLMKFGYRSKEIAEKLSLSVHTVNRHRQNIFQKLNVTNVMEACRIADGAGLF